MPPSSRLYVFSDGVYEVTRPDNTMLTFQEFMDIVSAAQSGSSAIPSVIETIRGVRGEQEFEDDVSIVEVTF